MGMRTEWQPSWKVRVASSYTIATTWVEALLVVVAVCVKAAVVVVGVDEELWIEIVSRATILLVCTCFVF